ncbi:MAG: spore coat U domain-containing protein [Byssovorax sp.]
MKNNIARNTLKLALIAGIASVAALDATTALAATDTHNLAVGATIANSCTIGTTPLAFGTYDGVGANATTDLDVASKVTVTCTLAGADVAVTLGQGLNPTGASTDAAPARRMIDGGGNLMTYSIFSNPGRTTNWDNITGLASTPTGSAVDVPIYGRVNQGQTLPAGTYADTVVATVTF